MNKKIGLNNLLKSDTRGTHIGIITISGFSFWFFLAFPFANHNESYIWLVQLNKLGFLAVLSQKLQSVETYRPLGQAAAWLLYKLFGGSIYPVELFSYLVGAVSWFILFLAIKEKRVFGLTSLITGGFFFSGYIYLFHLHGVFYSPLLLLIAILFFLYKDFLTNNIFLLLFLLAFFLSFYHPFALLIYLAYTLGFLIEQRKNLTKKQYIMISSTVILGLGLIKLLTPSEKLPLIYTKVAGLLTSYNILEVNIYLSITALLLSFLTAASINIILRRKLFLVVATVLISFVAFIADVPIVIIWILICLLKSVLMRKLSIAFLIIITFLFPIFTGTGTPTYGIFVLMICAAVIPLGWTVTERKLSFLNRRLAISIAIFALILICSLRLGLYIPIISKLANPILAEKEKTFQLEIVINWMIKSKYSKYELTLSNPASNPVESKNNAINRVHRAPTSEAFLRAYINYLRPTHERHNKDNKLVVCFGNEIIENAELVYLVKGKFAGNANVYIHPNNHTN